MLQSTASRNTTPQAGRGKWHPGTCNQKWAGHVSYATASQRLALQLRWGWHLYFGTTASVRSHHLLTWPSPLPLGMEEWGLLCLPLCYPPPALTISFPHPYFHSQFRAKIFRLFSFSRHGRYLLRPSPALGAESRTTLVVPATAFRLRWNSASSERAKFAN